MSVASGDGEGTSSFTPKYEVVNEKGNKIESGNIPGTPI